MSRSSRITRFGPRAGSAAILALALIVIVGFIGTTLVTSLQTTGSTVASHAQAVQAGYIADAGAEWACKHGTSTTAPVSFGGGTFEVTKNGDDDFTAVGSLNQAQCTVHTEASPGYPPSTSTGGGGLEYVLRSRAGGYSSSSVDCIIMNTSGDNITFNSLKVTWASPTAYFESITCYVANGTSYGTIWSYTSESDDKRWAKGEQDSLNRVSSVTIPAHYSAELHFLNFKQYQSGWSWPVSMSSATVDVEFYMDTLLVGKITIGLAPT